MLAAALTFQAHTPSGAVQAPAAGAAPLHTVTWPLPHQVHGSFARACATQRGARPPCGGVRRGGRGWS